MLHDDNSQSARICPAVRLCPALCPRESRRLQKNRAKTMVAPYEEGEFDGDEAFSFTVQPSDIGRLNMSVCDPPVIGAYIFLRYKHIGTSTGACVLYLSSCHDSGLTFGAIFEEAKSIASGMVWLDDDKTVMGRGRYQKFMHNSTLEAVTAAHIKTHGGSFMLDLKASWIRLDAVVPTEEEWETMRQVLAEEEAKKKLMDPDEHAAWMAKLLRRSV